MSVKKVSQARRALLQGTIGAATAAAVLPSSWTKPVVSAVLLPAHAMTSPISSLSVTKTQTASSPSPATTEGDVIEYTIVVQNTGDLPITGVVVTDTMPDGTVVVLTDAVESMTSDNILEVNESWTYTTSYTVTLADLMNGDPLVNSVSVAADDVMTDTDDSDSETTPVTVPECPLPAIINVVESGPTSGVAPCTISFDVVSSDTTTLTVLNIVDAGADATTTITYDPFGDVTDAMGIRVVLTNALAAPFCNDPTLFGDITFTVTTTCAVNVTPVDTDFTLSSILA